MFELDVALFVIIDFKLVHFHPHLSKLPSDYWNGRSHLSQPHEHMAVAKVYFAAGSRPREVDLLVKTNELRVLLPHEKPSNFGDRAFEEIAVYILQQAGAVLVELMVDGIEGAVVSKKG